MNQDICWFEIPVLHTLLVHLIQTNGNVSDNLGDLRLSERWCFVFDPLVDNHLQVALVGQLEYDVQIFSFRETVNNFRDEGVIE